MFGVFVVRMTGIDCSVCDKDFQIKFSGYEGNESSSSFFKLQIKIAYSEILENWLQGDFLGRCLIIIMMSASTSKEVLIMT